MRFRPHRLALFVCALVLAACSGGSNGSGTSATTAADDGAVTTVPATDDTATDEVPNEGDADEVLRILVSNDDGFEADGIDTLVEALITLPDVEVIVYAPEEQQSGTGGSMTDGPVDVDDVELQSGHPVRAVAGFPADTVRVAMDEEGVEPHLVVTGINEGQNLAPVMDLSGTVGAARAAVARGVPALATSQGVGALRYEDAVPFILDWIEARRDALLDGTEAVQVTNLNVPSCETGELRGLLETELATEDEAEDGGGAFGEVECESDVDEADLGNDVVVFNNGYASISLAPDEPADDADSVEEPAA